MLVYEEGAAAWEVYAVNGPIAPINNKTAKNIDNGLSKKCFFVDVITKFSFLLYCASGTVMIPEFVVNVTGSMSESYPLAYCIVMA